MNKSPSRSPIRIRPSGESGGSEANPNRRWGLQTVPQEMPRCRCRRSDVWPHHQFHRPRRLSRLRSPTAWWTLSYRRAKTVHLLHLFDRSLRHQLLEPLLVASPLRTLLLGVWRVSPTLTSSEAVPQLSAQPSERGHWVRHRTFCAREKEKTDIPCVRTSSVMIFIFNERSF